MNIVKILVSIYLISTGVYSLYSFYKNKETIHWELPSTTYLPKKIFGKHFNRYHNFYWGIISLIAGIAILITLFY